MKSALHIHQIFYSQETKAMLDPGYIALDNLENQRPDWHEYWPIRNYLLNTPLLDDDYYGFFSPKFSVKTGLSSDDVYVFIDQCASADVIFFSPFFDQIAYFKNIFDQAEHQHPGIYSVFLKILPQLGYTEPLDMVVTHSLNTIFCNFFVAKPAFWRAWLHKCEILFNIAEHGNGELTELLTRNVYYADQKFPTQSKVFVLECIASLLLVMQKEWVVAAFNSMLLPASNAYDVVFKNDFVALDSLKIAYTLTGRAQYLFSMLALRDKLSGKG